MSESQFTHVSPEGQPKMVDISGKAVTKRTARARAIINPGKEILAALADGEILTKKGPVFQTAIIAGVMGAKKTSELIPFCHPVALEDCQINIVVKDDRIVIESTAVVSGKTGVEMEALSAATIASLTVYDMCKALSHDIVIESIQLLEKTGGKKDVKKD
ncbi:MAG TPA: cyclic pyranopterin monophosphate synthase MoaC [Ohtaekwangia sp.]|nr:cyclic pyranopterin monophosphate synthase MoaC [Ohtaekwangia sp.]